MKDEKMLNGYLPLGCRLGHKAENGLSLCHSAISDIVVRAGAASSACWEQCCSLWPGKCLRLVLGGMIEAEG